MRWVCTGAKAFNPAVAICTCKNCFMADIDVMYKPVMISEIELMLQNFVQYKLNVYWTTSQTIF